MLSSSASLFAFSNPDNGAPNSISLPVEKAVNLPEISECTENIGAIPRRNLGHLVGGSSFPQTYVVRKFGRTAINPIFDKSHPPPPYPGNLSHVDREICRRRAATIRRSAHRAVAQRKLNPEFIVYTGDAAPAMILSVVILEHEPFRFEYIAGCVFPETSDA